MISNIKLGAIIYTIERVKDLSEKGGCLGATSRGDKKIYIDAERSGVSEVIHELIHQAGWSQGVDISEPMVCQMEFLITGVLKDNPKFLKLIQSEYHSK